MFRPLVLFFETAREMVVLAAQLLAAVMMTGIGAMLVLGGVFAGLIPLGLGLLAFYSFGKTIILYFE